MSAEASGSDASPVIDSKALVIRGTNDLTPVLNCYSDVAARISVYLVERNKKTGRHITPESLKVPSSEEIGELSSYCGAQEPRNVTNPFFGDIRRILTEGDSVTDRVELQKLACFWAIYILANKTAKIPKKDKIVAPGVEVQELAVVTGVAIPSAILQEFISHPHTQKWLEDKQEKIAPVNETVALNARVVMFAPSLLTFLFMFAGAIQADDSVMRNTLFSVMPEIMVSFRYGLIQAGGSFPAITGFLNSCGVCGDTIAHCSGEKSNSLSIKSIYCILKLLLASNPGFILGVEFGNKKTLNLVLYLIAYLSIKSTNLVRVTRGHSQTIIKQYVQTMSVCIASGTHVSNALLAIGSEQKLLVDIIKTVTSLVEEEMSTSFQGGDAARFLISFIIKMADFAIAFAGDAKTQASSPEIAKHILSRLVANKLFPFNSKVEDSAINSAASETSGSLYFPIAVRENPVGDVRLTGDTIDFARDVVDEVAAKFTENTKDKVQQMHVDYIESTRRAMIFSGHCERSHPYTELKSESSTKAKKQRLGNGGAYGKM